MSKDRANATVFCRRFFGVALCYALALQAILAAYSIALAVNPASVTVASFVICHNADDGGPAKPDSQSPVSIPCALCAMAAQSIALLPASPLPVAAPSTMAGRVRPAELAFIIRPPSARAGLARAPPSFA